MQLKEYPYWHDTVTMPTIPVRPLEGRVDVAIIGGGYTGLSAARVLAACGARTALFEAHTLGWGASSRNGGQVLTGMKLGPSALIKKYGLERARRLFAASLAAIDCVAQIVRDEGIACDFVRAGHLEAACKPAHLRVLAHEAELLARKFEHQVELLSAGELRRELGSAAYHGGLVDERSAGLNPARYLAGLAQAAARAGALLYEQTPLERVLPDGQGFLLRTARGALWAKDVFVATSGYTGPATPALQRRIVPIGSYIIATAPLPEALARELIPRGRMVYDTKNFLYYFRLTPEQRLLFGGRAGFTPPTESTVRESAAILRRGMLTVFPQLHDAPVEYAWGGTLGFAFDIFPHAGTLDGLYYAMGYAGHGVALATYLGTKLGQLICGGPEENPLAGLPFPRAPLGLYDGRPWFLPLAGLWYRFLDWVG
jgi:glycine/D-amino acid oxidase-like deaminating enzyme